MTVALWPFWSQQDKVDGVFRLDTCGNGKQLAYLAEALTNEGIGNYAAVPTNGVGVNPFSGFRVVTLPLENPLQRVHWDVEQLRRFFAHAKVAVLNNEYLAIPVRALFPKLRIVQMCPVPIDSGLFKHAFDAADLVVTRSELQRQDVASYTRTKTSCWPMYYDARNFQSGESARDIDVVFLPRCSANNATHHVEFIEQVRDTKLSVVFTDITRYLRTTRPELEPFCSSPRAYLSVLRRSKVAVSLYSSFNGEMGLYESMAAGCIPVVRRTKHTEYMLGEDYEYFTELDNLRETIERAGRAVPHCVKPLHSGSYQHGVEQALEDACQLLR